MDVATVTLLVTAAVGLPVAWLTWAVYREASRSTAQAGGLTITQVADQLAVAVGAQWEAEAAIRRLNDPYPLPVSWVPADPSLADSWDLLVRMANSAAGRPTSAPPDTWAGAPDDLAGAGVDLVTVLNKVPTGRLGVLGEPGAGKTMLMVRLVLDLLARRTSGSPVPILASVASWNPEEHDLWSWLAAQLMIDHSALANPPSADRDEPTWAAALLAARLILPVLDGLDEIPKEVRGPAIRRINDALRPGEHLVVTSRSQQYRNAVRPRSGVEVTFRGAAVLELRALDAGTVRDYLCDDAAGPVARARWDPVLKVLGTEAPVGKALSTPLMVGLARAIYNPRPGELAGALRNPAELCDPALADQAEVESLLFDAFVPAVYRHDYAGRWKTRDAEKWLAFLARHLEFTIAGPDIAWWQLRRAVPSFDLTLWFGLVTGLLIGVVVGIVHGAVPGALIGAGAGLVTGREVATVRKPSRGIHWRPPRYNVVNLGMPIIFGAVVGTLAGVHAGLGAGALAGAVTLAVMVGSDWLNQLRRNLREIGSTASPAAVLARDRKAGIVVGAVTGVGVFALLAVFGWVNHLTLGGHSPRTTDVILLAAWFGLSASLRVAWPSYMTARIWLALRRRLPWLLMEFLDDAHRRGVLRQAGAFYQFRHIELQHQLATRSANAPRRIEPTIPVRPSRRRRILGSGRRVKAGEATAQPMPRR